MCVYIYHIYHIYFSCYLVIIIIIIGPILFWNIVFSLARLPRLPFVFFVCYGCLVVVSNIFPWYTLAWRVCVYVCVALLKMAPKHINGWFEKLASFILFHLGPFFFLFLFHFFSTFSIKPGPQYTPYTPTHTHTHIYILL